LKAEVKAIRESKDSEEEKVLKYKAVDAKREAKRKEVKDDKKEDKADKFKLSKRARRASSQLAGINYARSLLYLDAHSPVELPLKHGKYQAIVATRDIPSEERIEIPFCCVAVQKCSADKCFRMTSMMVDDVDDVDYYLAQANCAVKDGNDYAWQIHTLGADSVAEKTAQTYML